MLFIVIILSAKSVLSQSEFRLNQYGYISAVDKIVVQKSKEKITTNTSLTSLLDHSIISKDSLIFNGKSLGAYIYGINLSEIKKTGIYQLQSNEDSVNIKISRNPYKKLYLEIHNQQLSTLTNDASEENLRQLLSVMYVSFTDSIFSSNPVLIKKLLRHATEIHNYYDDNTINQELSIKNLLLASTCMSFASFAEPDITLRKQRATAAIKLYIKAVEHKEINQNLDLKGAAALQLYLIFKDPSHLKELIHVLDDLSWPQDFKTEDIRLYFLIHLANIYNITDGFLVKNIDLGIHAQKSILSNTPKIYNNQQLIDYSLANLHAFQVIKEITYLKQLIAGLNYMSGLNFEGINHFDKILKQGRSSEKRKLLLLLNNVNLMI